MQNANSCFLSHSQSKLIFILGKKKLIPLSEKNNPVRTDISFDFYDVGVLPHTSFIRNATQPVSETQSLIFCTMIF